MILENKSLSDFLFPFRLAWRQLRHDKVRFATAISGVIFACVLVFMQLGFKDALFESATLLQRTMSGDVYLLEKQSEALWRIVPFPRKDMYRALSVDGVENVTALYAAQAPWKNPATGLNRTALILGIDPQSDVYPLPGLEKNRSLLKMHDSVLFDTSSRPEFGPVEEILREKGEFPVEISGQRMDVVGTFRMGITFSADGNLIVSDTTFFKLFPFKPQDSVDIGIISVKKGTDIKLVQHQLKEIMPSDIKVMTREEYIEDEKAYWNNVTPIGYIFNFGVIMGLFVGLVIVYQVLFNDITNHLHEYATLKAMGYKNSYFNYVVMSASLILAILGFIPAWLICSALYKVVEQSIFIQMDLNGEMALTTLVLISGMCFMSAFLAVKKLKSASPVDVFQ